MYVFSWDTSSIYIAHISHIGKAQLDIYIDLTDIGTYHVDINDGRRIS